MHRKVISTWILDGHQFRRIDRLRKKIHQNFVREFYVLKFRAWKNGFVRDRWLRRHQWKGRSARNAMKLYRRVRPKSIGGFSRCSLAHATFENWKWAKWAPKWAFWGLSEKFCYFRPILCSSEQLIGDHWISRVARRRKSNIDDGVRRRWIFERLPLDAVPRQLGRSILIPLRFCRLCYYCCRVGFASRASDRRPPWSMLLLRRVGGGEPKRRLLELNWLF